MPKEREQARTSRTAFLEQAANALLGVAGGPLARAWIVGPGDSCATCPMSVECGDRRRCLHLVASAGSSTRTDGPFRRFPFGARRVGEVASTRTAFVTHEDLQTLADARWLETHRVVGFGAWPIESNGELLGVLAAFSRHEWSEMSLRVAVALASMTSAALTSGRSEPPTTLRTLAQVQREAIEQTLAHTEGRVSGPRGAALILGLKPTTLISRMQKLGAQRPRDRSR